MEDLRNKDKSIKIVWNEIVSFFGSGYFRIVDYWEADNFAIGIIRDNKLIYISTWELNKEPDSEILCYTEFEILNGKEQIPYKLEKRIDEISISKLIIEIKNFIIS